MHERRRTLLAKIHLAKKALAMADDSYRDVLERVAGRRSAAEIGDAGLDGVLREMRRLGWRPTPPRRRYSPRTRDKRPGERTPADKIRALWIAMARDGLIRDGSERALGRWLNRQCGRYSADWLDDRQASRAIEALKAWRGRLEG